MTQLVLERFLELMTHPFELVLVYNGSEEDYMEKLREVYDFDFVVGPTRKFRFEILNEAYALCSGDYFMHLENDFYWDNPDAVSNAVLALEMFDELDFVRMEFLPFRESQFSRVVTVGSDKLGFFTPRGEGGPGFQFSLNPHVRRDRFPVREGFLTAVEYYALTRAKPLQPERIMSDRWEAEGKASGCLLGENFRHLGIYSCGGHRKSFYGSRFTLRRGDRLEDFNPWAVFRGFCGNERYRALFRAYLEAHGDPSVT